MKNTSGKKQVRLQDIAEKVNLSVATVSRSLAGHTSISEEARAAVQKAAMDLGYVAFAHGARKPRHATRTIGVLVSAYEFHNRFVTLLLENIHRDLLESGFHVLVMLDPINSTNDINHLAAFRPMIDGYLEGMILMSVTTDSILVGELQRLGMPVVLAMRSVDNPTVDVVEADNVRGGAEIMQHLYELGHRRIGLVMGTQQASTSRDRALGAVDFLRSKGIGPEDTPIMWNAFTFETGYSGATQLLEVNPRVSAIMAGADSIAMGVLEAAHCKGFSVPGQVSVAGFDDVQLSGTRLIGLTTIQCRTQEISRAACRRIIDRIKNGLLAPPSRDVMPVQLMRRNTTGPCNN
jgi:LacI family transcriptional regulator